MRTVTNLAFYLFLLGVAVAARGETMPHTLAELNQWYQEVPPAQNAATYFLQGTAAMKITDQDWHSATLPWVGLAAPPQLGKSLPPEMRDAIGEMVKRNQFVLPYFRKGMACKASRYPFDARQGPGGLLMYLRDLKQASALLKLFALWHANAGEGEPAAEVLMLNCGMIQSLEWEPLLVSQEVRMAVVASTVQCLEQALNRVRVSPEKLQELQLILKQLEEQDTAGFGFARGVVGDRISTASLFDLTGQKVLEIFSDTPSLLTEKEKGAIVAEADLRAADKRFVDETFGLVAEAWKAPYPRRLKAVADICSTREAAAGRKNYAISAMESRRIVAAVREEALGLAWWRIARAAVALEQFRNAHVERYPEHLSELFPLYLNSMPMDPFDGRMLTYRKAGNGYVLGASGANGSEPAKTNATKQVSFRVIAPPTMQVKVAPFEKR